MMWGRRRDDMERKISKLANRVRALEIERKESLEKLIIHSQSTYFSCTGPGLPWISETGLRNRALKWERAYYPEGDCYLYIERKDSSTPPVVEIREGEE